MENKSKGIDDIPKNTVTLISAIVGAIVQTIFTIIFTSWNQIPFIFAFLAAFPIALLIFFVISYFINRYNQAKLKDGFSIQDETNNTQLNKIQNKFSNEIIDIIEEMGITGATSRLSESKFEPKQCMMQANRKLFFLGILGSKWVVVPHVRAEFQSFLKRIQAQNGSVRFLLINPESEYFNRLKTLRDGAISDESLLIFKQLMKEFPCLNVRLYNEMPCFRLVFINDHILAISRYKFDKEGYFQSKYGWEAPHIVIDSTAPWSLYAAFELFYEQMWNRSKDLREIHSNTP
jgi:hypothetical protein